MAAYRKSGQRRDDLYAGGLRKRAWKRTGHRLFFAGFGTVVANTPNAFRNGAVGFIDGLGANTPSRVGLANESYGRGAGVGRDRGVGVALTGGTASLGVGVGVGGTGAVGVGVNVAVAVAVAVGVKVGVAVAVAVGVAHGKQ
jgi:hypothetical protein